MEPREPAIEEPCACGGVEPLKFAEKSCASGVELLKYAEESCACGSEVESSEPVTGSRAPEEAARRRCVAAQ